MKHTPMAVFFWSGLQMCALEIAGTDRIGVTVCLPQWETLTTGSWKVKHFLMLSAMFKCIFKCIKLCYSEVFR